MRLVELFKIIVLKIDQKKAGLNTILEYVFLRQELGVNINAALSGPRAGEWIGETRSQNYTTTFKSHKIIPPTTTNHSNIESVFNRHPAGCNYDLPQKVSQGVKISLYQLLQIIMVHSLTNWVTAIFNCNCFRKYPETYPKLPKNLLELK